MCIGTKVVHMKQSVKCFFCMVVSICGQNMVSVTDQLIHLWWLLKIIFSCVKVVVNHFSKNDWKNTRFCLTGATKHTLVSMGNLTSNC